MNIQSFKIVKVPILGLPLGSLGKKCHLDVASRRAQNILWGREWCLFSKVVGCVKLVLEVVPIKFITPFAFNLH